VAKYETSHCKYCITSLLQFDEASAGVEVVIADGVETIIEDENIQQFVHSETVSQSSASVCKVGVTFLH
jgi:hypothetical protein